MSLSIDALSSQRVLEHATAQPNDDLRTLSDRFDRLMAHEPDATAHNEPLNNHRQTMASQFVDRGSSVMRETFEKIQHFRDDAPYLDMRELSSRHAELAMQIAVTQFHFNACSQVAQSGKSGLQTLMKNQ